MSRDVAAAYSQAFERFPSLSVVDLSSTMFSAEAESFLKRLAGRLDHLTLHLVHEDVDVMQRVIHSQTRMVDTVQFLPLFLLWAATLIPPI